ncbi:unnamed protein product [Ascophyllum nodosum]
MEVNLIVDDRERKVFDHLANVFSTENTIRSSGRITYDIERLDVADYQVRINGKIVAIIERKSLDDYAASIKDGRTSNKDKLIAMREQTGCKVYYIIEGALEPSYTREFSGIKFSSILSSIRRLEILHDFHILYALHPRSMCKSLKFLCEVYSRLDIDTQTIMGTAEAITKSKPDQQTVENNQLLKIWASIPGISKYQLKYLRENSPFEIFWTKTWIWK